MENKKKIDIEKMKKEELIELEKKLGRHKRKEIEQAKMKKNKKFLKYFMLVTNMMYILTVPILAMIGFYIFLKNTVFKKEYPLLLILFLFLGAITGYWSLIKELTKMNKREDMERRKEKKDE